MTINITEENFFYPYKKGDILGLINVLCFLRKKYNTLIKFFVSNELIDKNDNCFDFFVFLKKNTDFFSENTGSTSLDCQKINVWDFRSFSGDLIRIKTNIFKENKLVIFPIFDAPYNTYRNWNFDLFYDILEKFKKFDGKKIICLKNNNINITKYPEYIISTDFEQNIQHILNCEYFIGGETFSSLLASAIEPAPKHIHYYLSNRTILHTLPFNLLKGKGNLTTY